MGQNCVPFPRLSDKVPMEIDSTPNAAQPKSRRRWYQYSLRTLLIVVTLAGCGFAWLGIRVREAREQAAAVAAISGLGGIVIYDYQVDARGDPVHDAEPPGPEWLHVLLGEGFFTKVYSVYLRGDAVKDAGLEHLNALAQLEYLGLGYTQVTDASLKQLNGMARLSWLDLAGTRVTDAGLVHLQGLSQLAVLYLERTGIGDAGLDHFKGLTQLQLLNLSHTKATDSGLEHLKGLVHLKELYLMGAPVTEEGVAELRKALPDCHIVP